MISDDLSEWNKHIHNLVKYNKNQNQVSWKACKQCGDKGFYLGVKDSRLGYDCLVLIDCTCASRIDWTRYDEKKKEQEQKTWKGNK